MSRLDLIVGPNGAGKTTFVRLGLVDQVPGSVFVNADEIARSQWPDDVARHAYAAARLAAETREHLIASRQPFIAETVFSHPSKLELIRQAKAADYYVALHALLVPERLAIARVQARVAQGGHDVPEQKIVERYHRLSALVADAVALVDTATFWETATLDGPRIVALFQDALPVGAPSWPAWAPADLVARGER